MATTVALLVLLAIIVIGAIAGLVVIVAQGNRARFLSSLSGLKSILQSKIADERRLAELEQAMDRLFSEHRAIESLNDAYLRISSYVSCRNLKEQKYCEIYLKKKYARGYLRYDDERF